MPFTPPPLGASIIVVQGTTVSRTVTTTTTSTPIQPISLGVFSAPPPPQLGIAWGTDPEALPFPEPGAWIGQLPPGFSFELDPASIMSGDSFALGVNVAPETLVGTYAFNIVASGSFVEKMR